MQRKTFYGALLILTFALTTGIKPTSAATLSPNDFKLQSFSKTVDFFDYVRAYAVTHGMPPVNASWHAYLYQNYINVRGFQLFYSGLINITAGEGALTIPVQSFLEHYKTPNGKNVLTSSSFIMLLAFNDTATSKYDNSPDVNDNLYASFSLGLDLTSILGSAPKPELSSKTSIIPLTTSDNKTWEWGMRYTNLTAVWWRMFYVYPWFEIRPIAITTYEELTFTYKLELDPTNHTAKLTSNYVIGRMTNLWFIIWIPILFIPIPFVTHFNSTGEYYLNGTRIPNGPTIHQFLESQHIKMSIVLFQNSFVLNQATKSTFSSQTKTDVDVGNDAEVEVSDGEISTEAGNEEIFKTEFGMKAEYKLYNFTDGNTVKEYEAITRTAPRSGYARNPLFSMHVALLKYVPLIVANIDPSLYQKAKDHMLSMEYADYFYIISYPTYSGFKIVHDPTYTAYIASTTPTGLGGMFGLLLIGGIIALVIIGTVFVLKRRRPKTQAVQPPAPPVTTAT